MTELAPTPEPAGAAGARGEPNLQRALLVWYARHARDLPWRSREDAYAVWVSEVMLQQTRAATVGPYFERWLERFPDVAALAAAPLEAVLEQWQGLGYYRRARMLHRAARRVVAEGGRLPASREGWLELPGVGDYTAGAIASIVHDEPVPAVDGNVRRVLARLYAVEEDPRHGAFRRVIHDHASRLAAAVPAVGGPPGDWTQALMELGATICTARSPRCDACPVARWCAALASGRVDELPRPTRRARPRHARVLALAVAQEDGRRLVARRPAEGLLGGLWEHPLAPWPEAWGAGEDEVAARVTRELGVDGRLLGNVRRLEPVEHAFSHLRLTVAPLALRLRPGASVPDRVREAAVDEQARRHAGIPTAYAEMRWVSAREMQGLPTSVLMDKIRARLAEDGEESGD